MGCCPWGHTESDTTEVTQHAYMHWTSAGDLRELPRVPLRGEGSCGGGGAPRDVGLFASPWTVDYQASLSMKFSRQEYWSRLPFPSPMHAGMLSCFSRV